MRSIPLGFAILAVLVPALAAEEPAIGHWGNYLMVTAPADADDSKVRLTMQQRVTVDFVDQPLSEVAAFLHQVSGVSIVLDPALRAANPTFTFKAANMELGTVLRWATQLTKCHIGYVDNVVVLSAEAMPGATRTTLYDVSDLVMPIHDSPGRELAYNSGSGQGGIFAAAPAEEGHPSTTIDELEDLLRKTTAAHDR